ncbi:MAG: hypothetical protein MI919_15250 [Holophagales bacterium]|nr:hypothetical protein [Holophagales bacterium]
MSPLGGGEETGPGGRDRPIAFDLEGRLEVRQVLDSEGGFPNALGGSVPVAPGSSPFVVGQDRAILRDLPGDPWKVGSDHGHGLGAVAGQLSSRNASGDAAAR